MNAHDFCLIVDNDRDLLRDWLARTAHAMLRNEWGAGTAEQFAEHALQRLEHLNRASTRPAAQVLAAEIVRLALSRIDWQEVAEHYRTKVEEGASA